MDTESTISRWEVCVKCIPKIVHSFPLYKWHLNILDMFHWIVCLTVWSSHIIPLEYDRILYGTHMNIFFQISHAGMSQHT